MTIQEQLADELENFQEIARHVKPSPGEIPQLDGVDIHGLSLPANGVVGGDHVVYIDFNQRFDLDARIAEAREAGRTEVVRQLELNRERAGILVADVSGHRMTDAVIAAMLHQSFLLGAYYELDVSGEISTKLFEHINTRFYKTNGVNKFFTMIYGEISQQGKFRFLSAAHPPPAIFSREYGRFMPVSGERLISFPPVGMLPSSVDLDDKGKPGLDVHKKRYEVNEIKLLAAGDILLLHTDGLADHGGGSYFPRVPELILAEHADASASEICDRLQASLAAHGPQQDDISVVVIKYAP